MSSDIGAVSEAGCLRNDPHRRVVYVDESEILLSSMIEHLQGIRIELEHTNKLVESGIQLQAQEITAAKVVNSKSVSVVKQQLREKEDKDLQDQREKSNLFAMQQVRINQWAILNSEINSFKFYESAKEVVKAFKYNISLYSKSSASLVKSIILTFNQSRGYYISGYLDDGSLFKKYGKQALDQSDVSDSKFFDEADLTFLRNKFHEAIKNQIFELTGREPVISNEVDDNKRNWCIFQGPMKADKIDE